MLLSEFYSTVSIALKRGTTLDSSIPLFARLAAQWMERNYTLSYMEVYRLIQVEQGVRTIELQANQQVKRIQFIRMISNEGQFTYLKRCNPRDFTSVGIGQSQGFWVVGDHTLVLENSPSEPAVGEAVFDCYSEWPVEPSESHPLLRIAADCMLYQVLFMMAAHIKDGRIIEGYKLLRDEALNTLTRAEDEFRYGGADDAMAYIPYTPG